MDMREIYREAILTKAHSAQARCVCDVTVPMSRASREFCHPSNACMSTSPTLFLCTLRIWQKCCLRRPLLVEIWNLNMMIHFQVKSCYILAIPLPLIISPNSFSWQEITGSASASVQPEPPVVREEDEQPTLPDIHKKGNKI